MKLKAIRTDLLRALGRVRKVAPEKTTMPILGHAVLRADAEANRLLVEGTSLITGVSGVMVANVEETGAAAVSADALYRVLNAAVVDMVELHSGERSFVVRAGRSKWKLPCMPAADHPGMPEPKGEPPVTIFDSALLRHSLAHSSYAVSKNDGNEALKGVLFQTENGTLKTVSTDGRRLGAVFAHVGDVPDFNHVLSSPSVEAILRFLDEADGPVSVKESSPYLYFSRVLSPEKDGGGEGVETMVVVKTIQNKFPPYHRIIPARESIQYRMLVNRHSIVQSVRRVMAAVKEKGATIILELHSGGKLSLLHDGIIYGKGRDEIDVDVLDCPDEFPEQDKPFAVQVNSDYLLTVLNILSHEEVMFSFMGKKDAVTLNGVVDNDADSGQVHLVMPIFTH